MMELIKSRKDHLYLAYYPKWEDYNFQLKSEMFEFYQTLQEIFDILGEKYPTMDVLGKHVMVRKFSHLLT